MPRPFYIFNKKKADNFIALTFYPSLAHRKELW